MFAEELCDLYRSSRDEIFVSPTLTRITRVHLVLGLQPGICLGLRPMIFMPWNARSFAQKYNLMTCIPFFFCENKNQFLFNNIGT